MTWSFQLDLLCRRLFEASALFRYHSQQTEDLYGEAVYHWPDNRGRAFALSFLDPQMQLVGPASASLAQLASAIAQAKEATRSAEDEIGRVIGSAEEIEAVVEQARRETTNAEHFAVDAISRAQTVVRNAQDIVDRGTKLGDPPI
jgi:hypothetical protein